MSPIQSRDPYDFPASPHGARKAAAATADDNGDSIKVSSNFKADTPDAQSTRETTEEPKPDVNGDANNNEATDEDKDVSADATEKQPSAEPEPEPEVKAESDADADDDSNKPNDASANNNNTSKQPQAVLQDMEIKELVAHRVNADVATVELQVHWVNNEKTWEPEWELQSQVPDLIFEYWDRLGGRDNATGLEVYHVFRLLKRAVGPDTKQQPPKYLVQWVGYRRNESTWEPEKKLRTIAPGELSRYEHDHGTTQDAIAKKRTVTRGPGRPRKKAKTVTPAGSDDEE